MLAYRIDEEGARLVDDQPLPEGREGWVRVRTRLAGVCATDLELVRGYMGFHGVLGHEFVGEALDGPLAGQRVVGGINFGCGHCERCAAGMRRHCAERTVLGILGADGVMAEQFLIPAQNLLPVPDEVSDEAAVFVEPLAAACEILEQIGDAPGGEAWVFGDGKLGPLIAQVLAHAGYDVGIVGRHLDSLAWLEAHGVRRLGPAMPERRVPLVVEATGASSALRSAIAATAPRGTLVLKTTVAESHELDLAPLVIDEITLLGSRCGPFAPALELLRLAAVEVEPLIDARLPLADAATAFARAAERGVRKILLEPPRAG